MITNTRERSDNRKDNMNAQFIYENQTDVLSIIVPCLCAARVRVR